MCLSKWYTPCTLVFILYLYFRIFVNYEHLWFMTPTYVSFIILLSIKCRAVCKLATVNSDDTLKEDLQAWFWRTYCRTVTLLTDRVPLSIIGIPLTPSFWNTGIFLSHRGFELAVLLSYLKTSFDIWNSIISCQGRLIQSGHLVQSHLCFAVVLRVQTKSRIIKWYFYADFKLQISLRIRTPFDPRRLNEFLHVLYCRRGHFPDFLRGNLPLRRVLHKGSTGQRDQVWTLQGPGGQHQRNQNKRRQFLHVGSKRSAFGLYMYTVHKKFITAYPY